MLERLRELGQGIAPPSLLGKKTSSAAEGLVEAEQPSKPVKLFCDPASTRPCVTVCAPKPGCECQCGAVKETLEQVLGWLELPLSVGTIKVGCTGTCDNGPLLGFPQKSFFYLRVHPEDVIEIVLETLVRGRILFPHLSVEPNRSYRPDIYYEKNSGLLAAIDSQVCMVEVAKYFLDFEEGLSCGKCVPCRLGMKRLQENMQKIIEGKGTLQDLEQIRILCQTMIDAPHCDFAVTSSRPILSAVTHFEDEFRAHIERQECPAGVCQELVAIQKKLAQRAKRKKKKK